MRKKHSLEKQNKSSDNADITKISSLSVFLTPASFSAHLWSAFMHPELFHSRMNWLLSHLGCKRKSHTTVCGAFTDAVGSCSTVHSFLHSGLPLSASSEGELVPLLIKHNATISFTIVNINMCSA